MRAKIYNLILFSLVFSLSLFGNEDPLPSWNKGKAKSAILEFIKNSTDPNNSAYVLPENRIATFDQDGTLWVEHPMYTQGLFALDRIKALAKDHPEWNSKEPYKSIIDGNTQAVENFSETDWEQVIAETHTGMSTNEFYNIVKDWLSKAVHPRFKKPFTDLAYQPMKEVLELFRANSYKTFIVTGGGQAFVRVYSQIVYGIPPEQVIGSSIKTKYEYQQGNPILLREPKVFFIDNNDGKAVGIDLFIGKKPTAAFGNSDGDKEMLEWTQSNAKTNLMMLVLHDDSKREYAYGPANGLPNTKVGTFSESLMKDSEKQNFIVISMKDDWNRIFSFDIPTK